MITKTPPEKAVRGLGNLLILWIPADGIASEDMKPTTAELEDETSVDITYSHVPDGFVATPGFEMIPDDRLTFPQRREEKGLATDTAVSTIVYGGPEPVADPLLIEGAEGFLAVRDAVPHNQDIAASDKWDIHPVEVKTKVKSPHTNAIRSKVVTYGYRSEVLKDITATA